MAEDNFIDIRKLIGSKNPKLLKWLPGFVISYLKRILHQKEINVFMKKCPDSRDADFCDDVMELIKLKVDLEGVENLPKEGKLVLAMNHPLAGLDAIALVSALRDSRSDFKFIVNDLLLNLNRMNNFFVGVDKHGKNNKSKRTQITELFSSDSLVCIFPAGLVSRKIDGKVQDLEWKKTFISQSKQHDRIIVPMHIDGRLSNFFYRLANFRTKIGIKTNIEMLYLSNELFKLKNSTIKMTIGKPIHMKDLPTGTDKEQAEYVRKELYKLARK